LTEVSSSTPSAGTGRCCARRRQGFNPFLQQPDFGAQLLVIEARRIEARRARRQIAIVSPPIEPDFLRFVQGADEKANPDGEQLDFGQGDLDVSRDDKSLIEHPIEHVDQTCGAGPRELESHEVGTISRRNDGPQYGLARMPLKSLTS